MIVAPQIPEYRIDPTFLRGTGAASPTKSISLFATGRIRSRKALALPAPAHHQKITCQRRP
jgi:hypothetical protein